MPRTASSVRPGGASPISSMRRVTHAALHVLEWPGADPPVLLIHHNRGVADVWRRVVDALGLDSRLFAMDLPGCGDSSTSSAGYSQRTLATMALDLISELDLHDAVLIGAALGGDIGLLAARMAPDRVSGVIMLDSGFPIDPDFVDAAVQGIAKLPKLFPNRQAAADFVRTLPASTGYPWSPVWEEYLDHTLRQLPAGHWAFRSDRDAIRQTTKHLADDLWQDIHQVQAPVLVLRGGWSEVFSQAGAEQLVNALPNASLTVLPEYHHLMALEGDLGPLVAAIRSFLSNK
jgi:esterase